MNIDHKKWDIRELELEGRQTDDQVNDKLKTISGARCKVCNGVIDYHMPEVTKIHLKILSKRSLKPADGFWTGMAWGAVLMSIAMTALWNLTR